MKKRITEILADESIAAAGQTFTKEFPSDFAVTMLALTHVGVQVTDEATLAETLAGFGEIEISTRNGTPIKLDADDLYYLNRDLLKKTPYMSKVTDATDNLIKQLTLLYPLNPAGVWDQKMGITPEQNAKVKVVAGSDTAAGTDARKLTITAIGIEGINPPTFMGAYLDSFTAKVGDNFKDVQEDRNNGILGEYLFTTTGREDLTTTDAPGVKSMGWAVSNSVKTKVKADVLEAMNGAIVFNGTPYSHTHAAVTTGAVATGAGVAPAVPNSDYHLLDLGLRDADPGVPFVSKLQAYIDAGVAEAMRLYPLIAVRNQ